MPQCHICVGWTHQLGAKDMNILHRLVCWTMQSSLHPASKVTDPQKFHSPESRVWRSGRKYTQHEYRPLLANAARFFIWAVSVKSHLSLLFREIPIVFKTRSSLTVGFWKKYIKTSEKVKYLNSKFNHTAFLHWSICKKSSNSQQQFMSRLGSTRALVWLRFQKVGIISSFISSRVANMTSSQQHKDASMIWTDRCFSGCNGCQHCSN